MTIDELNLLLEDIDSEMKNDSVPISSRSLEAMSRFSKKEKMRITIAPANPEYDGEITTQNASFYINEYFDAKYGDLLKIDPSPASYIILIKNDIFILKLPRIYGLVSFTIDKNLDDIQKYQSKPICNILSCIKGLTTKLAMSLNDSELKEIVDQFKVNISSFQKFEQNIKNYKFFSEALEDYKESIKIISSEKTNFGKAKWETLQFIEKIMKGLIFSKTGKTNRIHDLLQLNQELQLHFNKKLDDNTLKKINCSASVRYDSGLIDRDDSAKSSIIALTLFSELMDFI
jgi:hypothetical protein